MTADIERIRREAAEWHVLLHDQPEDQALRARFLDWLDVDDAHAEAWQSMERTFGALTAVADLAPPVEDVTAAAGARPTRSWARRVAMGLAAAIAVIFTLTQGPDLYLRYTSDYATSAAETRKITLDDGSVVQLAPETALEIEFSDGRRDVRLVTGAAHFSVSHDKSRPFAVTAGGLTATVLGTEFDVALWGNTTTVEVQSGRVRVGTGTGVTTADLVAGGWVRLGNEGEVTEGKSAPELAGGWSAGRMMIRALAVDDVVERIRPWYAGKIVVLDSALAARRVTGVYDPRDPAAALEALVSPYGGQVTRVTPWMLVVTGG